MKKREKKLSEHERFAQIATKMVKLSLMANLLSRWTALKEDDPINNDIFQLPALVSLNLSNVAADDDHDVERYISNILLDGTNEFFEDESVKTLMKDINNQGKHIISKYYKELADAYDKIFLKADLLRIYDAKNTLLEEFKKDTKEFDFVKFAKNPHFGQYLCMWFDNYLEKYDSVDDLVTMTENSIYNPSKGIDSIIIKPVRGGKRDVDVNHEF